MYVLLTVDFVGVLCLVTKSGSLPDASAAIRSPGGCTDHQGKRICWGNGSAGEAGENMEVWIYMG